MENDTKWQNLQALKELHNQGFITKTEYRARLKQLIDELTGTTISTPSASQISTQRMETTIDSSIVARPPPDFVGVERETATKWSYDLKRAKWSKKRICVQLDATPFARGALRVAYHMRICSEEEEEEEESGEGSRNGGRPLHRPLPTGETIEEDSVAGAPDFKHKKTAAIPTPSIASSCNRENKISSSSSSSSSNSNNRYRTKINPSSSHSPPSNCPSSLMPPGTRLLGEKSDEEHSSSTRIVTCGSVVSVTSDASVPGGWRGARRSAPGGESPRAVGSNSFHDCGNVSIRTAGDSLGRGVGAALGDTNGRHQAPAPQVTNNSSCTSPSTSNYKDTKEKKAKRKKQREVVVAGESVDQKQASFRTYVAKISLNPEDQINREAYFRDVEMQCLAGYIAERFNRCNPPKQVQFLDAFVVELEEREGAPICGVERYISGPYRKHNSNYGYVNEEERNTPQAFSHFSWHISNGEVLLVDIQGVSDLYTDPQVHSVSGKGYGKGNLGMKGIRKFLECHRCNRICQYLRLPPVNDGLRRLDPHCSPLGQREERPMRPTGTLPLTQVMAHNIKFLTYDPRDLENKPLTSALPILPGSSSPVQTTRTSPSGVSDMENTKCVCNIS